MPRAKDLCRVPVEPFRTRAEQLMERGEVSLSDIALWLGYEDKETTRVQRLLGMRQDTKNCKNKRMVSYEMAVRLCDALGMDYWEGGV